MMRKLRQILAVVILSHLTTVVSAAENDLLWSLRKPTRPQPPPAESLKHAAQVRNPIDQFVLFRLEEAGLELAPGADRRTLVRRAYFDLIGLPPSALVRSGNTQEERRS